MQWYIPCKIHPGQPCNDLPFLPYNIKKPFCTVLSFSIRIFNFQYFILSEVNISFSILKGRFHGSVHTH